ncbi:SANT/Myb domain [Dillenia turbinata]|uniref:SANT/Myb domain n=1 Tax=Dillenia turbinata TaxID=194707 RepID=A0AAN8VZN8_9MAGN
MELQYEKREMNEWSWEENKMFEMALAVVNEEDPDRWAAVASMVGGGKTAEQVHQHYVFLLEDLHLIESGNLDHKIGDFQSNSVQSSKIDDDHNNIHLNLS